MFNEGRYGSQSAIGHKNSSKIYLCKLEIQSLTDFEFKCFSGRVIFKYQALLSENNCYNQYK